MQLKSGLSVAILVVVAVARSAVAQELEPRAYRTLPTGLNFMVVSYSYSTGNVVVEATSPISDLDLRLSIVSAGLLRSFGIAGRSSSVTVLVPYGFISGSAVVGGATISDARSGAADLKVRLAVNLLGGPALSPKEFASYRQRRNVGVSLTAVPPTGQYDPSRLINFGSNRWGFKPEVGYSSIKGRWILDAAAGVWFFTDNDEFFRGTTRSQDPIGSLQAHLSYSFRNRVWIALDGNYYTGGRSTVDGVLQADLQRNSRWGLTLSVPLAKRHSLKLAADTGALTSIGADFDRLTVSYQVRWPDLH